MKSKYKQFREAVKNPRPDRLAKIEYQSHFMGMLGITIVCIVLILRGFWWVIFAFVFGLGVSYSQGMKAYITYNNIRSLMEDENPADFKKDISPTRRRGKIIVYAFGEKAKWLSSVIAVVISWLIIGTSFNRWILMLVYPMSIGAIHILFYLPCHFLFINYIREMVEDKEVNQDVDGSDGHWIN